MATQTYTAAGAAQWLCPAGVTSVTVEVWGGGGGGGYDGGGAGGGGAYASAVLTVVPGAIYILQVGAAGQPGSQSQNSTAGGSSAFYGQSATVSAGGGARGTRTTAGAAGAGTYSGGAGGTGITGFAGGGGGSSGAPGYAGVAGTSATRGTGPGAGGIAPAGGGDGGNGGYDSGAGPIAADPGDRPGGGGGGGAPNEAGGGGGGGQVTLTYPLATQPVIPVFTAGYGPQPSDFDSWIQAPLAFLTSKIVFRAALTTATSLPAGSSVVLPFNDILEDPLRGWQPGSHEWLVPAGYSGIYAVTVTASSAPQSVAPWLMSIIGAAGTTVAGATVTVPAAGAGIASASTSFQLYGGTDSVQGRAYIYGADSTTQTAQGQQCTMTVTWLAT